MWNYLKQHQTPATPFYLSSLLPFVLFPFCPFHLSPFLPFSLFTSSIILLRMPEMFVKIHDLIIHHLNAFFLQSFLHHVRVGKMIAAT